MSKYLTSINILDGDQSRTLILANPEDITNNKTRIDSLEKSLKASVTDAGGQITGKILEVPPKNVFSCLGSEVSDAPEGSSWVTGIVLSQNWNEATRYKRILCSEGYNWYFGCGRPDGSLTWERILTSGNTLGVVDGANKFTLNVSDTFARLTYTNKYGNTYDAIRADGSDVSIYTNTGTINLYSDVSCTGNIYARSGFSESDQSLKENIVNANDLTTEKIAAAPLVRFKWKDNAKDGYGTLAQYWQDALPDVVSTTKQGTLSIDTARIGMASAIVLARKVKELELRLKKLEHPISEGVNVDESTAADDLQPDEHVDEEPAAAAAEANVVPEPTDTQEK